MVLHDFALSYPNPFWCFHSSATGFLRLICCHCCHCWHLKNVITPLGQATAASKAFNTPLFGYASDRLGRRKARKVAVSNQHKHTPDPLCLGNLPQFELISDKCTANGISWQVLLMAVAGEVPWRRKMQQTGSRTCDFCCPWGVRICCDELRDDTSPEKPNRLPKFLYNFGKTFFQNRILGFCDFHPDLRWCEGPLQVSWWATLLLVPFLRRRLEVTTLLRDEMECRFMLPIRVLKWQLSESQDLICKNGSTTKNETLCGN